MKTLLALAGGSAASAAISTAALTVFDLVTYDGLSADAFEAMIGFMALAFIANFAIAGTLGMLWHGYLQSRRWTSLHAYWSPAVVIGALPPFMILRLLRADVPASAPPLVGGELSMFLLLLALGATLGGLTAAFAWLIRRPDRDQPNPPTSPS